MSDDEYIGLTPEHEGRLRAMATSAGLSPAYRETIGRALTELDMFKERDAAGGESYRNAWQALRMIREAVETLGRPGAMQSEEAVLATLGPEPVHEAQAIIDGIQALAGASQASGWTWPGWPARTTLSSSQAPDRRSSGASNTSTRMETAAS